MALWLEGRTTPGIVMTTIALTGATRIVRPGATDEGRCRMTEMAIQTGRDVGGISLGILACRGYTVARLTIVNDAGMVEGCRDKPTRVMADTTVLVGHDMIELFALGECAIMTGDAIINDPDMVKASR